MVRQLFGPGLGSIRRHVGSTNVSAFEIRPQGILGSGVESMVARIVHGRNVLASR
jgi:hypothetical protein